MIENALLLAVDTCGATGSIALGRVREGLIDVLGERLLEGREFAASLVPGIEALLAEAGVNLIEVNGIVAVAGPGSFTGIRIGLATVKGIAEACGLPVVTVSRLALLAVAAGTRCAVLDAHRGQFYCGIYEDGAAAREMLLTAGEVNAMGGLPGPVGVCEEAVAQLLEELAGASEPMRVDPPSAVDALRYSLGKWRAGELADVAVLDGYYLRGSDAKVSAGLG